MSSSKKDSNRIFGSDQVIWFDKRRSNIIAPLCCNMTFIVINYLRLEQDLHCIFSCWTFALNYEWSWGEEEGLKPEYISIKLETMYGEQKATEQCAAVNSSEKPMPPKRLSTHSYFPDCTMNVDFQHSAVALNHKSHHCDLFIGKKGLWRIQNVAFSALDRCKWL